MRNKSRISLALLVMFTAAATAPLAEVVRGETLETETVTVTYAGITDAQARALADTLAAARQVYVEQFKLDMPDRIVLSVECGSGKPTRLYTDGNDRVFLSLPNPQRLAPPMKSGVFNLYGMCHELGHVAMYRTLSERPWLSGAGAEGWAHYTGSVVVDEVFAAKGENLWPEPYDYSADGTARLDRALAGRPDEVTRAAGQWRALESIIGRDGFTKLFEAWNEVQLGPSAPPSALIDAAKASYPDKADALAAWWNESAPVVVDWASTSPTKPQPIAKQKLLGQPITLKRDDDTPDSKRSIGGGGHAIRFDAPDANEWYLVAVEIHGSRYGPPKAPGTMFTIALCDADMRPIQTWRKPYAAFPRASETEWVKFELPPVLVPQQFYVCIDFKPTATNGVYVAIDASTSGQSRNATPGRSGSELTGGNWMIRAEVDAPRPAQPATRPTTGPAAAR